MDKQQTPHKLNIVASNLVNICVDENENGELHGRIYDCFHREARSFHNLMQLLWGMEELYEGISFPQASTRSRFFICPRITGEKNLKKVQECDKLYENRGKIASFMVWVRSRQNATWQGEVFCLEQDEKLSFVSALDLIKIIDNILGDTFLKKEIMGKESC